MLYRASGEPRGAGAAGYGDEAAAVLFYCAGNGEGGIWTFLGLSFLRTFYHGGSLMFGPTLLMIMLTVVEMFMAFMGIILHSMSMKINETQNKCDFLIYSG